MNPEERIIVPIDQVSLEAANDIVRLLSSQVSTFKLGFVALSAGFAHYLGKTLKKKGKKIFWDMKFADISNTLSLATEALTRINAVDYFTVYGSISKRALEEAVDHRGQASVLVVTILTDIDSEECHFLFGQTPEKKVLQIAERCAEAGAQGVVCSPQELKILKRRNEFDGLRKIAVSVRPSWYHERDDDQKRSMTPKEAIGHGATDLVIGRPITKARLYRMTEKEAFDRIVEEITITMTKG